MTKPKTPKTKTDPKAKAVLHNVFMCKKGNEVNHVIKIDGKEQTFAIGQAHKIDLTKLDFIAQSFVEVIDRLIKSKVPDSLRLSFTASHGGTLGLALKDKQSFKGLTGYHGTFNKKPLLMVNNSGMLKAYATELINHIKTKKLKGLACNTNKATGNTGYAFFAYVHEKPQIPIDALKHIIGID